MAHYKQRVRGSAGASDGDSWRGCEGDPFQKLRLQFHFAIHAQALMAAFMPARAKIAAMAADKAQAPAPHKGYFPKQIAKLE